MTVLVTSDFHLSDNPRDAYRLKTLATIRKIAKKHKVTRILFLGDVTEAKDRHSAWLVNRIVKEFYRFSKIAPIFMLQGNHDSLEIDHPFYEFLHQIDGITWIKQPVIKEVESIGSCLFLPHTRDHKKDWARIDMNGYKQIFAHNTFEGAKVESGREMKGIPTSVFPQIRNHVISGDIHVPQRVGPVVYTGAPYTVDFGDNYQPRVLLLNKDAAPFSVQVPGAQKVLIELFGSKLANRSMTYPGDIVKVRVHLKNFEYAKWHEIREKVVEWCDQYKQILHSVHPIVEQTKEAMVTKATARSDTQLMREFAKISNVDERTLKRGIRLL